jgi:hypothetical protein
VASSFTAQGPPKQARLHGSTCLSLAGFHPRVDPSGPGALGQESVCSWGVIDQDVEVFSRKDHRVGILSLSVALVCLGSRVFHPYLDQALQARKQGQETMRREGPVRDAAHTSPPRRASAHPSPVAGSPTPGISPHRPPPGDPSPDFLASHEEAEPVERKVGLDVARSAGSLAAIISSVEGLLTETELRDMEPAPVFYFPRKERSEAMAGRALSPPMGESPSRWTSSPARSRPVSSLPSPSPSPPGRRSRGSRLKVRRP